MLSSIVSESTPFKSNSWTSSSIRLCSKGSNSFVFKLHLLRRLLAITKMSDVGLYLRIVIALSLPYLNGSKNVIIQSLGKVNLRINFNRSSFDWNHWCVIRLRHLSSLQDIAIFLDFQAHTILIAAYGNRISKCRDGGSWPRTRVDFLTDINHISTELS